MILGHNLACELFFIFSIPYRVYVQIIQFTVENIRRVRQRGKSMAIKGVWGRSRDHRILIWQGNCNRVDRQILDPDGNCGPCFGRKLNNGVERVANFCVALKALLIVSRVVLQ